MFSSIKKGLTNIFCGTHFVKFRRRTDDQLPMTLRVLFNKCDRYTVDTDSYPRFCHLGLLTKKLFDSWSYFVNTEGRVDISFLVNVDS
jgi:hypothetical protein